MVNAALMLATGMAVTTMSASEPFALALDCRERLATANLSDGERGPRDSNTFRIYMEGDESDTAEAHMANARKAVELAVASAGCLSSDLRFWDDWQDYNGCNEIVAGNQTTRVCVVAANVGYFFVMDDLLSWTNVVWNRWD